MLNFLRNNQPFFFILYSWIILIVILPIKYFKDSSVDSSIVSKTFLSLPFFVYYILFAAIVFYTSFKINRIINKSVLFPKSFYLSGLIYLILMLFYSTITYSILPAIGNLFVVLALEQFFKVFRNETCKNLIFKSSLFLVISMLFSPLNIILLPVVWVILFVIRPFDWREYIMPFFVLILFGLYIVPFGLINGELFSWFESWWVYFSSLRVIPVKFSLLVYIVFLSLSLFLSINPISSTFVRSNNRYKKVTWVVISLLFFTLCSCFTSVFFLGFYPPFIYPFFVPISIIIATGLIRSRFKWIIDLLLIAFFIVMVLLLCLQ